MLTVLEISDNRKAVFAAAESILAEVVPTLRLEDPQIIGTTSIRSKFTREQLAVFDTLGWDNTREGRHKLWKATARMFLVLQNQAVAGSAAEREQAREEADAADAALRKRGPQIDAAIDKLQAERKALEADKRAKDQAVTDDGNAIDALRELAPEHLKEAYFRERGRILEGYAASKAAATSDAERRELEAERQLELDATKSILDCYIR